MLRKSLAFLSLLFCVSVVFNSTAQAQDSVPASTSSLTGTNLPSGAARIAEASVPGEFNQALDKLIASGGERIKRGKTEVLVWTSGYKKSNVPNLIKQITGNLQTAGWTYEAGPKNDDVAVFTLITDAPTKRAIVGLYTYTDEALVLAWTEMLVASKGSQNEVVNNPSSVKVSTAEPRSKVSNSPANAVVLNVGKDQAFVNVMGNEMPAMPKFQPLQSKPGSVRGYVKDSSGKPLAGATIGIRASYFAGMYSGAQGITDANGYYEFVVPKGSAHYYNAGYQIEWGGGIAAVGLHPADGKLESFTVADGTVENFVMLPYGITSRENISENPFISSAYYGGSVYISYYTVSESDRGRTPGSVVEDSIIEITLTPEGKLLDGTEGKPFVIRHTVGFRGNFNIHNIPLGSYQVSAKMDGKPLKMKQNRKFNPLFGMNPAEATGSASILFIPDSAKASMVTPQAGGWTAVDISLSTQ